ncbi:MAG TPA: maleylpyruvate isomerase family mycothiol-dependent enzyme [Pseudonocardiaceae bacterium]|nr:maleylpyruvate isomerase family mycothiol-dependent enzyme [Pseudonocardiaceae bacterium]
MILRELMDYPTALVDQNAQLAALLRDADWSTPVPTCPGWTLTQLMRHVGRGDRWAAQIIADRVDSSLDPRLVRDGKPPADDPGALRWLADSPRTLLDAVRDVGADTEVSTFLGPRRASWWIRRRLHEATIHRADAAFALDTGYGLSADLAADGISEWLDRLVVEQSLGRPAVLPSGTRLVLRATDSTDVWTVAGTAAGITVTDEPADGDVRLEGPAADLLLALVRRRAVADTSIQLEGTPGLWHDWLDRTPL